MMKNIPTKPSNPNKSNLKFSLRETPVDMGDQDPLVSHKHKEKLPKST